MRLNENINKIKLNTNFYFFKGMTKFNLKRKCKNCRIVSKT